MKNERLVEILVVASVPVAGYVIAYIFERGYANVFDIPPSAIGLDLISVLTAVGALAVASMMALLFTNVSIMWFDRLEQQWSRRLFRSQAPLIIMLGIIVAFYGPHWREWLFLAFLFVFFGLLHVGVPIALGDKSLPYTERLHAADEGDRTVPDLYRWVARNLGSAALLILVYAPLVLLSTWHLGRAHALRESRFLVVEDPPSHVVLRTYGERFVLGEVDSTGTRLTGRYRINSMSSVSDLDVYWRDFDILKLDAR